MSNCTKKQEQHLALSWRQRPNSLDKQCIKIAQVATQGWGSLLPVGGPLSQPCPHRLSLSAAWMQGDEIKDFAPRKDLPARVCAGAILRQLLTTERNDVFLDLSAQ